MSRLEVGSKPSPAKKTRETKLGSAVNDMYVCDRPAAAEKAVLNFLSPKRMVPNSTQRAILNTASVRLHEVNGLSLQTYVWHNMPGSPYVILGHGFMLNAASMLRFVRPLLRAGFAVVTWDHPGHGESEGDSTYVQTWADSFATIAPQYAPLAGVVGFSLSGTTALMALAEDESFKCPTMVCINSPRQVVTVMQGFLMKHGCSRELIPLMHEASDAKGWRFPQMDKDFMSAGEGLPGTQCLFIQDRNDLVASEAEARYWASMVEDASSWRTDGLGHQGLLLSDKWISRIVGFLEERSPVERKIRSRI